MTEPQNPCVVVVDDEAVLRMLAAFALEDASFGVIEAASADEAARILERHAASVHVVFTDIHTPGSMNGVELAHHCNRRWPHLGVMVTSARPPVDDRLPTGCRFLPKPYELSAVVRHVSDLAARQVDAAS